MTKRPRTFQPEQGLPESKRAAHEQRDVIPLDVHDARESEDDDLEQTVPEDSDRALIGEPLEKETEGDGKRKISYQIEKNQGPQKIGVVENDENLHSRQLAVYGRDSLSGLGDETVADPVAGGSGSIPDPAASSRKPKKGESFESKREERRKLQPCRKVTNTGLASDICKRIVIVTRMDPTGYLDPFLGTVLKADSTFCYIIFDAQNAEESEPDTWYVIEFPGGKREHIENTAVVTVPECPIVAMRFATENGTEVDEVTFGPRVERNEEVLLLGWDENNTEIMTDGHVNAAEFFFTHDCAPQLGSYLGGPVFNKDGELVGLSFNHEGVLHAHYASEIKEQILLLHPGQQTLGAIFQSEKVLALAA